MLVERCDLAILKTIIIIIIIKKTNQSINQTKKLEMCGKDYHIACSVK